MLGLNVADLGVFKVIPFLPQSGRKKEGEAEC